MGYPGPMTHRQYLTHLVWLGFTFKAPKKQSKESADQLMQMHKAYALMSVGMDPTKVQEIIGKEALEGTPDGN